VSFNVPLVLVNAEKNIYFASNNALAAISDVRDKGYSLIGSPAVWGAIAHALGWSEVLCSATNGPRIIIGGHTSGVGHVATTDDNGATWTQRTITSANKVVGVAYGEPSGTPAWVAVTEFDGIETSADGTTWAQQRVESGSRQSEGVRWIEQEQLFFVYGDQQRIFTSPTCASGTLTTLRNAGSGSVRVRDIAAINGYVIAVTNSGTLYRMASGSLGTQTVETIDGVSVDWKAAHATATALYIGSAFGLLYVTRDGLAFTSRDTGLPTNGGTAPTILDIHSFNGYVVASCSSGHLTFSQDDGSTWRTALSGVSGDLNTIVIASDGRWIAGSSAADIVRSNAAIAYASAADLEDDTLAPEHGNYGVFLDAAGSYVRLGSPADGLVTGDLVEGAASADRTHGQLFVKTLQRAGLASSPNLVTNPSALSNPSGWSVSGTCSGTTAVATRKGYSFSRINNVNGGDMARVITLTGNTQKIGSWLIISNGVAGFSYVGIYDNTASAWLLLLQYTIDANGALSVTVGSGSLLSVRNLGGGMFLVTGVSTTATAAHTNLAYANASLGTATLTSVLMADVTVKDAAAEDDWLAFDIVALDDAQPAECGFWTSPEDAGLTCGEVLDQIAGSCGAGWFPDQYGVLRILRLENPAPNLVDSPDDLSVSPWEISAGLGVTPAYAVYEGKSFTRISNLLGRVIRTPVTLPYDGPCTAVMFVKSDGVTGTMNILDIYDSSVGSPDRVYVTITVAGGGVITAAVGGASGTLVRAVLLPGGNGVYGIVVRIPDGVAAHANYLYVGVGGSGLTSILVSEPTFYVGDADITIDQNDLTGPLAPVPSSDPNDGIPPYRTVVRWGRNYAGEQRDLAADTSESLKPQLVREWREAVSEDAAVLTRHPTSQPLVIDSLFAFASDAEDEADRWEALMALELQWYEATLKITNNTKDGSVATMTESIAALDIGSRYEQVHSRYELGAGRRFAVMGAKVRTDETVSTISLDIWG
jgi:hypothetical protein